MKKAKASIAGDRAKRRGTLHFQHPEHQHQKRSIGQEEGKEDNLRRKSIFATGRRKSIKRKSADSEKFIGMELEWDSETVRNTSLYTDNNKICIVLVMEETSELSEFTASLSHAINSGIRKKYTTITASEIEDKVKQFMTTSCLRETGVNDTSYRGKLDLWAEAIKSILLKQKEESTNAVEIEVVKNEITGVRSKDQMHFISPVTENKLNTSKTSRSDSDEYDPNVEPNPVSQFGTHDRNRRKSMKPKGPVEEAIDKKKKKSLVQRKLTIPPMETVVEKPEQLIKTKSGGPVGSENPNEPGTEQRKTFLKRRGAVASGMFQAIDDSPKEGPNCYVVLAGFYNPQILDELKAIGVHVDSIILLTHGPIEKHNFSILDLEEKISGVTLPQNTPPENSNSMKEVYDKRKAELDSASSFWLGLIEMINHAPGNSYIHDVALMNCLLPKIQKVLAFTPEDLAAYGTLMFENFNKTIGNMLDLKEWFSSYKFSFEAMELPDPDLEVGHKVYDELIAQVPSECHTVSIVMDCLLTQIAADLGETLGEDEADVHIIPGMTKRTAEDLGEIEVVRPPPVEHPNAKDSPIFLNNFDFATIRACHLNNNFASRLAATQISKDFTSIRNFLWVNIPDSYNEEFKLKVFESLKNFMYFLPSNTLTSGEMSFITHLLLAKGIEIQLHKLAELEAENQKKMQEYERMMIEKIKKEEEDKEQDFDNPSINESDSIQSVVNPSVNQVDVPGEIPKKQSEQGDNISVEVIWDIERSTSAEINGQEGKPIASSAHTEGYDADRSDARPTAELELSVDAIINKAAKVVRAPNYRPVHDSEIQELQRDWTQCKPSGPKSYFSQIFFNPNFKCPTPPNSDSGINLGAKSDHSLEQFDEEETEEMAGSASRKPNNYIACEQEFFETLNEPSVMENLVECPGLLPVGGNGRVGSFSSSHWTQNYLMILGLCGSDGQGTNLGKLEDWNYMEEYRPTQMIQLLSEALRNYISFERVYVPYYDTLIFMFNNPSPPTLSKDVEFFSQLKSLPGIQDFLEYTVNEPSVLNWLLNVQSARSDEITDSFSATTLLRLIPKSHWILNPSIKYNILLKAKQEKERTQPELPNIVVEIEEEEEEFGQLKKEKARRESKAARKQSKAATLVTGTSQRKIKSKSRVDIKSKTSQYFAKPIISVALQSSNTSPLFIGHADDKFGDSLQIGSSSSFNFSDAIRVSKGIAPATWKSVTNVIDPKFFGYDIGKRVLSIVSNTTHLFPLDGTKISYEIQIVDPNIRIMQLSIDKNGHSAYFYPHYIPHDNFDLASQSYVVTPSFHLTHSTGIIFAFNDKRVTLTTGGIEKQQSSEQTETGKQHYEEIVNGSAENQTEHLQIGTFDYEHVVLGSDNWRQKYPENIETTELGRKRYIKGKGAQGNTPSRRKTMHIHKSIKSSRPGSSRSFPDDLEDKGSQILSNVDTDDSRSRIKKSKSKKLKEKSKEKKKEKDHGSEKHSKKLRKKDRGNEAVDSQQRSDDQDESTEVDEFGMVDLTGEYVYSSAENTDAEETLERGMNPLDKPGIRNQGSIDSILGVPKLISYNFSWKDATKVLNPMSHNFRVTFPSGLCLEVEDDEGPPLRRQIKQSYLSKGSGNLIAESSRYYLSNGSVIRFLMNKTIQVLNVRGVTTVIRDVFAEGKRDEKDLFQSILGSKSLKVFNGSVLHPTGEHWEFVNGHRKAQPPMELFTSSPLPSGEVFCRRQDGLVYLHRADGTVITHYPDGTRFTSRIILLEEPPEEEFSDWIFVGIKLMVENPHYSTVIFNSLSGNVHVKLSHGWIRIFDDGSVRINFEDNYKMDVDKFRAIISNPSCITTCNNGIDDSEKIPNMVAVKLWHCPEFYNSNQNINDLEGGTTSSSKIKLTKGPMPKKSKDSQNSATNLQDPNKVELNPDLRKLSTVFPLPLPSRKPSENFIDFDTLNPEDYPYVPPNTSRPNFDIEDFMTFTDKFTFCKAIDSWDNRFALDIFGQKVVDQRGSYVDKCTQDLVDCISRNFNLPKRYVSGILDTTSSENLLTKQKRLESLLATPNDVCEKNPKIKIFVMKKDLSGYQFLRKSTVDYIIKNAKSDPDSTITTKLHEVEKTGREQRSITILQPVLSTGLPFGTWKASYREPVYRPPNLSTPKPTKTNSQLGWFAKTLLSAHTRRPSFIKSPKESFAAKREEAAKQLQLKLENDHKLILPEDFLDDPTDVKLTKKSESEEVRVEEEADETENESLNASKSSAMGVKKSKKEKSKFKGKKNKKEKLLEETTRAESGKKSKMGKKAKSKKSVEGLDQMDSKPTESEDKNIEMKNKNSEGVYPFTLLRKKFRFIPDKDLEYKDYPEDIPDITDIYGIGESEDLMIREQYHPNSAPRPKQAIVVRTIKELPKIDERLQRALLSASLSYNQTIREENEDEEGNWPEDELADIEKGTDKPAEVDLDHKVEVSSASMDMDNENFGNPEPGKLDLVRDGEWTH